MSHHFSEQIARLKSRLLRMCELVEQSLAQATRAFVDVDKQLAWDVIKADAVIDRHDIEVEEECLHTLALYQPVAYDMRFVASVLTINKDLERIGDLSVNLAEQALSISDDRPGAEPPFDLSEQCDTVLSMVRQSIKSLVDLDAVLARRVIEADDQVDQLHRDAYREIKSRAATSPGEAEFLIDLLIGCRQLERIADCAVNIAEDVLYTVEGKIVRHRYWTADVK